MKLARHFTRPAVHRGLPRRLPRPDLRRRLADRLEGEVPRGLQPAAAGHLPRAVREGRRTSSGSTRSCSSGSSRPTRSPRSSSSRSRARAATSSRRTASSQGLRELCDKHGILLVADEIQSGAGRTGQDVGDRALGRRAGHPAHRQGHRQRHAARARWSPVPTSWSRGASAPTARRTAAIRSRARRRSPRSSCSRAGSSTTPRSAASRPWPACARSWRRHPKLVLDVRGKGLMIGVEFASPELRRGGPVGVLPARPARPRVRRADRPHVPAARRLGRRRSRPAVRIFGEAVAGRRDAPVGDRPPRPPRPAPCTRARSPASVGGCHGRSARGYFAP